VIKTNKFSLWIVPKFAPQIQNGGRQPSWKQKNCDISETVWPILTKFCIMAHISPPELICCSKIKLLKIQDGRRSPFWKLLNVISQQPFDRFWWNLVQRWLMGNQKVKNSKIQDGGLRPSWKNEKLYISKTVSSILLKFCMMTRNSFPELTSYWKN